MCNESSLKVKDFIKSEEIQTFYTVELNDLLKNYEPGKPEYKQDVINEIKRRDEMYKQVKPNPNIMDALRYKTAECAALKEKLAKLLQTIKDKNLQEYFT